MNGERRGCSARGDGPGLGAAAHRGPGEGGGAEVVPRHLVNPRLEDVLEVLVLAAREDPREPEFVDVKGGGVRVVEDHRVAQPMARWPIERLGALEACA